MQGQAVQQRPIARVEQQRRLEGATAALQSHPRHPSASVWMNLQGTESGARKQQAEVRQNVVVAGKNAAVADVNEKRRADVGNHTAQDWLLVVAGVQWAAAVVRLERRAAAGAAAGRQQLVAAAVDRQRPVEPAALRRRRRAGSTGCTSVHSPPGTWHMQQLHRPVIQRHRTEVQRWVRRTEAEQ